MLTKITSWVLYACLAVSVVFAILFYFGGINEVTEEPLFTTLFLNWGYILFFAALAITLVLQLVNFIKKFSEDRTAALKSLGGIVGLGLILVVAYGMGSDAILKIPGYDGAYNTHEWSLFTDTVLYSCYFLGAIAALSIIVTSVVKVFR